MGKRALTSGVEKGAFLQTTGRGASGSFKLAKVVPMISAGPKRKKKAAAKKPAAKKPQLKSELRRLLPKRKQRRRQQPKSDLSRSLLRNRQRLKKLQARRK